MSLGLLGRPLELKVHAKVALRARGLVVGSGLGRFLHVLLRSRAPCWCGGLLGAGGPSPCM